MNEIKIKLTGNRVDGPMPYVESWNTTVSHYGKEFSAKPLPTARDAVAEGLRLVQSMVLGENLDQPSSLEPMEFTIEVNYIPSH